MGMAVIPCASGYFCAIVRVAMELLPQQLAKKYISLVVGSVILGAIGMLALLVLQPYLVDTFIPDAVEVKVLPRKAKEPVRTEPCEAGKPCDGPTVSAKDPEGEQVTYRFIDSETKQDVTKPIRAASGEQVTPKFEFASPGEKKLYMVVEDGAGHTSAEYPVIVPVR